MNYWRELKQCEEEYAAAVWATEVWRDAAVTTLHPKAFEELRSWIVTAHESKARLEYMQRSRRSSLPRVRA